MTHVIERSFEDTVGRMLADEFSNVRKQPNTYISKTGRFPDFLAEGQMGMNFAIEIENDFESVFDAVGKAQTHAACGYVPLVIVPVGHVDEPERTLLEKRSGVPIVEVGE